jgi:hypothetical protein
VSNTQSPRRGALEHRGFSEYTYPVKELDVPIGRVIPVELLTLPVRSSHDGKPVAVVRRRDLPPELELAIFESSAAEWIVFDERCAEELRREGAVRFKVSRSSVLAPQCGDKWVPVVGDGS